jgi:hypothetical protein
MVRLYSNGTDLDLGEFATTLTFSIADIREPDKRNASFSKTLTLPGTKANNLFFENMFEVDVVTQTFNPNLKATTVLSIDGVTQFKGALKLRQVNYLLGGKVTYDCNLIGNLSDLFQEMGNLRLRDLDLSAYDHTYNKTNVVASWSPTLGVGYVYPMINYGENSDLNSWEVMEFRAAVFAKTILDKIISTAGYSYTSTFLTSDLFKRLIVPNTQDKLRLTDAQVNTRLFNAGRTTSQTFTDIEQSINNITNAYTVYDTTCEINNDSTAPYFDNGGTFDTAQYRHEPNYNGLNNYFFSCNYQIDVTKIIGGTVLGFESKGKLVAEVVKLNTTNNVETSLNTFIAEFDEFVSYPSSLPVQTVTATGVIEVAVENVSVGTDDVIFIRLKHYVATNYTTSAIGWTITNISFKNSVANNALNIGDTVEITPSLPDMLQKDFVTGLFRMFNLYLEPDKDDETLLNIEPRDTYYNSTQVDWSAKLAAEKDLEIQPMAMLNFKRIVAQYKDDSDYYNKVYKQEYTRNYGSYLADIDNDFVNGDYKIETTFAPTPLVGNYENDRIIPTIFEFQSGTPPTTNPYGAQPRILYWGGLKNCETWTLREFVIPDYKTQYPYAGHLDDPQAPTLDLSFGIPQKVYYGVNQYISSLTYTDNNLYNTYYSQMISEVTDRDSKLVTGYFWLTPVDILNLDFRKIYRVGSHALRLNKIYDYNPVKSNLTKCEFIKIKDTSTFVSNSEIMNGGIDIVVNARENAPVIDMSTFQDGNVVARPSTTVITGEKNYAGGGLSTWIGGKNNRVHGRASSGVVITGEDNIVQDGASGVVIHGYNNTVGFGAKSLFIQGDRNTIAPNLENVTLIATDGITVTESNVSYFNDAKFIRANNTGVIYSASLSIPTAQVLTLNATQLDIVAAPGAGYAIEVVAASFYSAFVSAAYATNTTMQLINDTATTAQFDVLINYTVTNHRKFGTVALTAGGAAATQIISNKSLKLKVATGNPTAGNSDIKVYVLYRIITL